MSHQPDHQPWREQIAAAASERRPPDPDLAEHLAACARCTEEWRRINAASARMILAARNLPLDVQVPASLRARTLARRSHPPSPALAPTPGPRRGWIDRLAWAGAGLVAGAAAVLLGISVLGGPASPDRLTLTGSELAPLAEGVAQLDQLPNGTMEVRLTVSGLPASEADDFYEVWLIGEGGRVSAGTFRTDGREVHLTFLTAADPERYPQIGITAEPDDGDPAPSGRRVAGST